MFVRPTSVYGETERDWTGAFYGLKCRRQSFPNLITAPNGGLYWSWWQFCFGPLMGIFSVALHTHTFRQTHFYCQWINTTNEQRLFEANLVPYPAYPCLCEVLPIESHLSPTPLTSTRMLIIAFSGILLLPVRHRLSRNRICFVRQKIYIFF